MNIKMVIDKTGHKHPSWAFTPIYSKNNLTPNLDSPEDCQCVIQPHPIDQVEESEDYETISASKTFDIEQAEWKENEAFRLRSILPVNGTLRSNWSSRGRCPPHNFSLTYNNKNNNIK